VERRATAAGGGAGSTWQLRRRHEGISAPHISHETGQFLTSSMLSSSYSVQSKPAQSLQG